MDNRKGDIPAELLIELETLRPIIERQGVVQQHHGDDRKQTYRLRYREFDSHLGYTRHRSIPLGSSPVVVQAVSELIRRWQDEYQADDQQDCVQLPVQIPVQRAAKPEPTSTELARELAQEMCGGGRRRREQIGDWYDNALNDPVEMLKFNFTGAFPKARKGGRPPKKRSW